MKYVDYYQVLGVPRDASQADIKKAYRKLAHQYHPDVSKNKNTESEDKFKEAAQAYATLKDPEKRAAYDELGRHPQGADFDPPHQWQEQFHETAADLSDVDLADLLAAFAAAQRPGGQARARRPVRGHDFEVPVAVTLEQIYNGAETEISVAVPDYDSQGLLHHVNKTFRVKVPKGASDGQRLRLPRKGGSGLHGAESGDLYMVMQIQPHKLYRISGNDLYLDLPLSPWEAALGATIQIPTLGGSVEMKIPPGTVSGRKLRLSGRGLPSGMAAQGDLYAVVHLEIPKALTTREHELFSLLAAESTFNPRSHFDAGG